MNLVTGTEMAAIDRLAIEQYGIPSLTLMENAGRRVVDVAIEVLGGVRDRRIALVCGKGNNGGDGLVAARHLLHLGARPKVCLLGSFQELKADPQANLKTASRSGVEVVPVHDSEALGKLRREFGAADLVVDAVLGTGFSPPARGLYGEAISFINQLGPPVLAVDLPSGLPSDHGRITGEAVNAHCTVTFALPKLSQILYPAAQKCGTVYVADIGIPAAAVDQVPLSRHLLSHGRIAATLLPRSPYSHKGSYGHVLLVAGSRGFVGAAALAARGALRAGTGLLTVALPESQAPPVFDTLPEAMILPLPETEDATAAPAARDVILRHLENKKALAVGPGLSRQEGTVELVRSLVPEVRVPLVLDADGLNALAGAASLLLESKSEIVITPHPGEMGRLLGRSVTEIQSDRIEAARDCAKTYGCVVVLKGAGTVIANPAAEAYICPTGNSGMATAGMGDVLTGMIASFLAQGYSGLFSAILGAYLHGAAGDLCARERGPWGFLAGEVADRVPAAAAVALAASDDAPNEAKSHRLLVP